MSLKRDRNEEESLSPRRTRDIRDEGRREDERQGKRVRVTDANSENVGPSTREDENGRVCVADDGSVGEAQKPNQDASSEEHVLAYPSTTPPYPAPIPSTPFQQPNQLTAFSYTPTRELVFDNSAMKYYIEPPRGARLDYGFDKWVRRGEDEERGRIDSLLRALSKVREDPVTGERVKELGVVSWRGVMTKILTAPYEERDGWELNVMKVNGTLYFEEFVSDARVKEKQNMNPRQTMQTYYGYAFESYCTADTPRRPQYPLQSPDDARSRDSRVPFGWSGDVNNNVQWCSVVRTKLGNTRILIGGEVDCVRDKYTGQPDTFVELKTSLTIRGPHDEARFEKKLLKFYFQSFLLGVPEIVVGFRTPAGVVSTVQTFRTVEMPRLVRGKPGGWDPVLCLDWGRRFLEYVGQRVEESGASAGPRVWRVWFWPGRGIRVREVNGTEMAEVVHGEDRAGFLPGWYWRALHGERATDL